MHRGVKVEKLGHDCGGHVKTVPKRPEKNDDHPFWVTDILTKDLRMGCKNFPNI